MIKAFLSETHYKHVLVALLLITFLLHIPGMFYSFPLKNTVGDEVTVMSAIFKMMNDGSLRPNYESLYHLPIIVYAELPFYIVMVVFTFFSGIFTDIESLRSFVLLDHGYFLPFARFLSVLFAMGALYAIFRVSKKIFQNNALALFVSFLLSFNLMFFLDSHFARAWSLQILLMLFALYQYVIFDQEKDLTYRQYVGVGVGTALASGVHPVGGFVYIVFLYFFFSRPRWRKELPRLIMLKISLFATAGLYYLLNPYGFLIYIQHVFGEQTAVDKEWTFFSNYIYYLKIFITYDWFVTLFFIPSLILLFLKYRRIAIAFSLYIFLYIGIISYVLHPEPRFVIAVVPFIALIVGYGVWILFSAITNTFTRRALFVAAACSVLALPLFWNLSIIKPNTRLLTRAWILNTVPENTGIVTSSPYLDIPETQFIAQQVMNRNTLFATAGRKFLVAIPSEKLSQPRYHVVLANTHTDVEFYSSDQIDFEYLILEFWNQDEQARLYEQFNITDAPIKIFYPISTVQNITDIANNMQHPFSLMRALKKTGPYIEVYNFTK